MCISSFQTGGQVASTVSANDIAAPSNVVDVDSDTKQALPSMPQPEPVSKLREGAPPSYDDVIHGNVSGKAEMLPSTLPLYPSADYGDLPYPGTVHAMQNVFSAC